MIPPEIRNDPFSAADEAFFQAAERGDTEALSERPVTLDDEASFEEPVESSEREARRARFVRPVASMVAALGVLTLVGLTRHALRTEPSSFTASEPAPIAAAGSEAPATAATHDIVADFVGSETDDSTALLMSTCEHTATSPLVSSSTPGDAEARAFDAPPSEERSGASAPAPDASEARRREPAGTENAHGRRLSKAAPLGKAALLSAIRASRPSHGEPRKTL
jgi:hypothetical protein